MRWLTAGRRTPTNSIRSQILSGRRFRDGQPEVMLGDLLAQDLKKKPGDTMEIQGTPFTVTGIYHAASALEADAVIMPLDQLQQLSSLQGKVSTIHVRLRPAPAGVPQQALSEARARRRLRRRCPDFARFPPRSAPATISLSSWPRPPPGARRRSRC